MKQCKRCDSENLTYVTAYEHLDFATEDYIFDNGWLCDECECFHMEDSYEYYVKNDMLPKVNYSQLYE
jgi:hypothetical protein